jgi:hypothetical protein
MNMKAAKCLLVAMAWILPTGAAAQETPAAEAAAPEAATPTTEEPNAADAEKTPEPGPQEPLPVEPTEPVKPEESLEAAEPEDSNPTEQPAPERLARSAEVGALMQSLLFYRNDSDFDRTQPVYAPHGQSVGALATIFAPSLKLNVENLSVFYSVEVGLNLWSKNNPDQFDPTTDDAFFLKHRELYAQGTQLGGFFSFKVGYQHIADPSGLMLNHWTGAARIWFGDRPDSLVLSVGQVPDTTYEGFILHENNFVHDTFFVQGQHRFRIAKDKAGLTAGVLVLADNHVIGRKLTLATPMLGMDLRLGPHEILANLLLQIGRSDFAATADATHLASAFEIHGAFRWRYLEADINAFFLSGDDRHIGNNRNGSFLYSGKNRSATLLLTEDELRDRGDNFDERMGKKDGGFFELRSGLAVADLKLTGIIGQYLRPAIIAGLGFVTQPDNALGKTFAGFELDADVGIIYKDILSFHLVGGMLVPGEAAGALVNNIDPHKSDNVYQLLTTLNVRY